MPVTVRRLPKRLRKTAFSLDNGRISSQVLQGCQRLEETIDHALPAALAMQPQPGQAARGGFEVQIVQRQIAHLAHPQPAAQHEQKHRPVARAVDDCEELFQGGSWISRGRGNPWRMK